MQSLKTLQEQFTQALKPGSDSSAILPWINESRAFSASSRIEVYRYAYFERILESLEEDFPAVKRWVGDERFRRWIQSYLVDTPPKDHEMALLGQKFSNFLARSADSEFPFLPDLANLEWAMLEASYAEDPYFDLDHRALLGEDSSKLQNDPDGTPLSLCPSVRLIESFWDLKSLLNFDRTKCDPYPTSLCFCVYRGPDNRIETLLLSRSEQTALSLLNTPKTIPMWIEELHEKNASDSGLGDWLRLWFEKKLVYLPKNQ